MKTTPFTPVNLHVFVVNDTHAIVTSTLANVEPVKDQLDALTLASFDDLASSNAAMSARMNQAAGDPATKDIDAEDLNRDGWWREIKRDVKTACASPDSARKEAGLALKIFFTPYWDLQKAALPTETDMIEELDGKLQENTTMLAHMAILGLTTKFDSMKTSNTLLKTLYNTRTSASAAKAGTAASVLKANVANSYSQFCYLVELAHVLTPSDTLTTLFNNMEQLRKKYAPLYNISNDDEEEATDTNTSATQA